MHLTPRDMCRLANEHKALVFLDECHATGFLGDTGRYVYEWGGGGGGGGWEKGEGG